MAGLAKDVYVSEVRRCVQASLVSILLVGTVPLFGCASESNDSKADFDNTCPITISVEAPHEGYSTILDSYRITAAPDGSITITAWCGYDQYNGNFAPGYNDFYNWFSGLKYQDVQPTIPNQNGVLIPNPDYEKHITVVTSNWYGDVLLSDDDYGTLMYRISDMITKIADARKEDKQNAVSDKS